jgi:PIN domain nuclease of toxin-antitoxin system
MKLLIDTHVLIWAFLEPEKLPLRINDLLTDKGNLVLVSAASAYEIEFKRPRSAQLQALPADMEAGCLRLGFSWLPIMAAHAVMAGRLPRFHRDPFDRMIVAQGLVENATLVSADPEVGQYGVPILW